ncbi:MAG: helical backbone metal receptor, partial [Rhodothermales bacterium]|nr:helical backbone metal receptor [Rhodothermales bacterium]
MAVPLTDARGRGLALERPPRRIVSLVPSQTELLADLGLDDEVVGLTRFCVHPEGWKARKPVVGGTKNVRLDRVEALRPDLVLANREENEKAQVEALEAFAPVFVTDVSTVEDALRMIRTIGALVGRAERAEALAGEVAAGFAALEAAEPVRAAYLIWRSGDGGPYMTVGGDTFIHDVMRRASLANVFGERSRYPEVTAGEIAAARPDAVLLSSEPFPFGERHAAEVTAAVPGVPVRLVDGELFSWYGSRMRLMPP